jgi:diaminohydroxyphosphoribosylaminopyrimidine deaminase/5-amino-6-(5-phosphoribosylamino)uracil reductase
MRLALQLAERARGHTHPNPVVGAVVVEGGRIVARGWHHRAGGPHAEIVALDALGRRAPRATLYVTLEPCCHTGRTGPCTERVLTAGIRRVVIGCLDENPLVSGKGVRRLQRAGVRVDVGCLEGECRYANRGFFRWIREGRPQVTLKAAATLDGFIAPRQPNGTGNGRVHWITGPAAREAAHRLRAGHDAILVGVGTVLADDPQLTVRLPTGERPPVRPPLRVVLDGHLRTPPGAQLLRPTSPTTASPPLLVTAAPDGLNLSSAERRTRARRERALRRAGAELLELPTPRDGRIPLPRVLAALATRAVQSLLVEGGSQVHGAFIAQRLVDEVAVFLAPRLQGDGVPLTAGPALPWASPLQLGPLNVQSLSGDILLRAEVQTGSTGSKGVPRRRA